MKGRNFDYGSQMSNSKEGEMAKRTLITMAKDLYNLYTLLRSEDDLPSWCHYKLAKSQVELQSVNNYLTSKITKLCIDENIPKDHLSFQIQQNMNDECIAEGIFDILTKRKNKSNTDVRKNLRRMHNPEINYKNNYVNETIKFINLSTKIATIIRNISGDSSYELDKQTSKVPKDSISLLKIVKDECVKIQNILKTRQKFEPKITSARKNIKKTPWYKKLIFREDYSINTKNVFLSQLESLLDNVSMYFNKNVNTEHDLNRIRQLTVYSDQDIDTLLEDLNFTIKTIRDFISKEEAQDNEMFDRVY